MGGCDWPVWKRPHWQGTEAHYSKEGIRFPGEGRLLGWGNLFAGAELGGETARRQFQALLNLPDAWQHIII